MNFLIFFDYGGGNYTKSIPGQNNWLQIYSVGPGVRYRIQNYLSFRFDWGYQLKTAPFTGMKNKVHLGLMLSY
jgi:hemolysin activation/secretion protein